MADTPKTVDIVDEDGSVSTIAARDLGAAQKEGARVAAPEEVQAARTRAQYGDTAGELKAGAAGAARGLTLGISDRVLTSLGGDETRRSLAALREANPTASLGGELAGAIAPVVLSGGAAAPEEFAALGGRGLASGAAERGAARLLGGEAESLAGRIAQQAISKGVGASVEGALYGAAEANTEAALSDNPDALAEKLMAHMGRGAMLGGLLGGGLGAGAEILGTGARAGVRLASGAREGESVAQALDRRSGELAWRSAGGTKAMARGADRFAGGADEVGKIWRDEAPGLAGKRSFREMTREDLNVASARGKEAAGAQLDARLAELDEIAARRGALPRAIDVGADIERVASELSGRAGTGPVVEKLQNFARDIYKITGVIDGAGEVANADARVTFRQLRDFRVDADRIWAGNSVDPSLMGYKAEFKKARDLMEERLTKDGDRLAQAEGAEFAKGYEEAKRRYQAFAILEKAAGSGTAAEATNRLLSLTDNIVGSGAAQIGAAVGSLLGAPGAAAGAAIGGAAGALANRAMRRRFDFVASDLMSQASKLGDVQATAARVDARLREGVKGFLRSGAVEGSTSDRRARPRQPRYEDVAPTIMALKANPAAAQQIVDRVIAPVTHPAPQAAVALAAKMAAGLSYLTAHAPETHRDPYRPQQHLAKTSPPNDLEVEEFERRLAAFLDPESVVDDMKEGRITPEGVETLQTVYPEIFQRLVETVKDETTEKRDELEFDQLAQMSTLTGFPLDEFLTDETLDALQATYDTPAANTNLEQQAARPPARPIQLAAPQSGAQQIEARS
jgi:hypothetical protein